MCARKFNLRGNEFAGTWVIYGGTGELNARAAARVLLEAGFDFVTDMDGFKIFRRRK